MTPINNLAVLVSLILCTGCSLPGPQQSTAKRAYMLQGDLDATLAQAPVSKSCVTLRIGRVGSAPGFMTNRMAYTKEPQRLDYFAHHEWVDTPAKMIASAIEARLDSTRMFGAVLSGSSEVKTDFRLDADVIGLLQDFDVGNSNVILKVKVNLVDVSNRKLLNSRSFGYIETANGANPEAGVIAANYAVERFLIDLVNFLAESVEYVDC